MTRSRVHFIDWRTQFDSLKPYVDARGGVVSVHATDAAPSSTFSKALRRWMAECGAARTWCSIQVDPENSNTHYCDEIVEQIERSLQLEELVAPASTVSSVNIGTDVSAGGDVSISNVNVGGDHRVTLRQRTDRIGDEIRARADEQRVALIFVESHQHARNTLIDVYRQLWEPVLAPLVDQAGLLLIDISDPGRRVVDQWPPDPDLTLDLPVRHEGEDLKSAVADVARIIAESRPHQAATAEERADTLVCASADVRQLHALVTNLVTHSQAG
jgi:hypothetical protein